MIEDHEVLSFNYLKKQAFTGSFQGMRYCLRKKEEEEKVFLEVVVWPEPLNLEHTDPLLCEYHHFDFSEEGRTDAIVWLNEQSALLHI